MINKYAILVFLLILCGKSVIIRSLETITCQIELSLLSGDVGGDHLSLLPESFLLKRVVISADVIIDQAEIAALTGFVAGPTTRQLCKQAFKRIAKKQKFDRAFLSLTKEEDGYALELRLHSFWTLAKVCIEGDMIGKDRYRHYYQGEPGEAFDEVKHKHGLLQIEKIIKTEGYLAPHLADSFSYDETTKSVAVTIHLKRGKQFVIDDAVLSVVTDDKEEGSRVQATLQKVIRRELHHAQYSHTVLNEVARQLKRILLRKGYLDATIKLEEALNVDQGRVRLYWIVSIQHKKAFEFIGNHFFSSQQLFEQLLPFGKSLALIPASLLAEEITLYYKKQGFLGVQVSWREEKECIFFCITESQRARLTSVAFEGVAAYCTNELIQRNFSSLLKAYAFDGDMVKQALDSVIEEYIKDGFWDSTILSYDYISLPDGTWQLAIKVHEGEQRFLAKVSISGFEHLAAQGPFDISAAQGRPMPFDIHRVQEQRVWLMRYLQERGYLYATPHLELIPGDDGLEIRWEVRGYTEQVRFGPTIILGANHIPANLIVRELEYQQGEVWDKKKIDRSLQRLKALGIFDTVSLVPDQMLELEPTKTVLVRCLLDDPVEVRVRSGVQIVGRNLTYKGGATYKIGASLVIKNPTNQADSFHVDMDFTRYRRDIAAYYRLPWLGRFDIKTEMRVYSSSYDQPIVEGSDERLYKAVHDGMLLQFTKDIPHAQAVMNLGVEWMALKGVSPQRARELHFDPKLIDTRIPYFFFEPTIFLDYLDDKVYPTRGSLTLLSCKGMIPFDLSRAFFIKMLIEQSLFIPLPASMVMALRLRCGHIIYESFRLIMPPERFYLGGYHSLRGYDPDLAPPLNCFTDCNGIQHLIPIGGKSMLNGTIELRFPLIAPIWAAVFTDIGFLAQDSWSRVNAKNMLACSGFGLRYNTPFGPISFDIGWKWHTKSPLERSFAWFLTFGQAF